RRHSLLQPGEAIHQVRAFFQRLLAEGLFQHVLDVGERRGTRNRIASEGGEVIARLKGRSDFVAGGEGRERESVGNTFGRDQDVRLDAEVLDGEHFAGAAEAGLHFIADEEDAVAVENLFYLAEVVGRRNDNASLAHHGLGDERPHVAGGGEAD